jgi:hypothetical protein
MSSAEFAAEVLVLLLPCWRPLGVTVVTGDFAAATIKEQGITYARAGIRVRCLPLLEGVARFGFAPAGSQHSIRAAAAPRALVPIPTARGARVAWGIPFQLRGAVPGVTRAPGAISWGGRVGAVAWRYIACLAPVVAPARATVSARARARVTAPLIRLPCRGCCAFPVTPAGLVLAAGRVLTCGTRPAALACRARLATCLKVAGTGAGVAVPSSVTSTTVLAWAAVAAGRRVTVVSSPAVLAVRARGAT